MTFQYIDLYYYYLDLVRLKKANFGAKSFSPNLIFKAQFWPRKKITDHPLILRMKYYHFHHLETMVHNKYKVLGLF